MGILALVAAVASAASLQPARYVVAYRPICIPTDAKTTALRWNLGLRVEFRYRTIFDGFAATLTPRQADALRSDRDVEWELPQGAQFVVGSSEADGVEPELRFARALHAFAAHLTAAQLASLEAAGAKWARPDPWVYIVLYRDGVPAHAKTDELAARLGFTPRHYYDTLGGFSAVLTSEQLAALDRDPDVQTIGPNAAARWCEPPPRPAVLAWETAPNPPRAGRDFAARAVVPTVRRPHCLATVGPRRLRVREASVRAFVVTCRWRVPRAARGRVLRATLEAEGARRSFAFSVR